MTAPAQPMPGFDDPGAIGGVRPRIADLRGRVVFIQPLVIARGVPGVQPGQVQDRITANIMVVDGGPLDFGGKPEKYIPHTLQVATPYLAEGVYISQVNLISALLSSLPSPQRPSGGIVLGRIVQGVTAKQGNNPPWNLQALEANDPARALAGQVLQQLLTGAFQQPEVRPTGAPMPPGGPLAYTHAVTMPHNPVTGQPVPNPAEVVPQAPQQPYSLTPAAPAQAPTPSQQVAANPAPTGWPQEAWDRLTPDQQQQIRLAQQGAVPAAPANGATPF